MAQAPLVLRKAAKEVEDKRPGVEELLTKIVGQPIKVTYDFDSVYACPYTDDEKKTQLGWYLDTASYNSGTMWTQGIAGGLKRMCENHSMIKEAVAGAIKEVNVGFAGADAKAPKWTLAVKDGVLWYKYDKKRGGPPDATEVERELMKQMNLILPKAQKDIEEKKAGIEAELTKALGHDVKVTYDWEPLIATAYPDDDKRNQILWCLDTSTSNSASMWKSGVLGAMQKMGADEISKEALSGLKEVHVGFAGVDTKTPKWTIVFKDGILYYKCDKKRGSPPDMNEIQQELNKSLGLHLKKAVKALEDKKASWEEELTKTLGHPVKVIYDYDSFLASPYSDDDKRNQLGWFNDGATYNSASAWKSGILGAMKKMCADEMTKEALGGLKEVHIGFAGAEAKSPKWTIVFKDGILYYKCDNKRGGPPDQNEIQKELMKVL